MPTPQAPIGCGFGPTTTASDVIRGCDLTNKVAIIAGGYASLDLETTRAFLSAGAKVIVPARDHEKATNALSAMPGAVVEALDLTTPASIDSTQPSTESDQAQAAQLCAQHKSIVVDVQRSLPTSEVSR